LTSHCLDLSSSVGYDFMRLFSLSSNITPNPLPLPPFPFRDDGPLDIDESSSEHETDHLLSVVKGEKTELLPPLPPKVSYIIVCTLVV